MSAENDPNISATSSSAELYQAAVEHFRAGRRLDAERCCRQALGCHSDHADALHLLGILALHAGQYDQAVDFISRAIRREARHDYLRSLGTTLLKQGRHADALQVFGKSVQVTPDSAEAWRDLGNAPFFLVNSDTLWIDGVRSNLARLAETFDPARMDIFLLMAPTASSIGYSGSGDYAMLPDGALRKRRENQVVPFVYAGAAIISPAIFADAPAGAFSLTRMFDRANEQERLFGLRLDGVWMHVGTPDAIAAADEAFLESVA